MYTSLANATFYFFNPPHLRGFLTHKHCVPIIGHYCCCVSTRTDNKLGEMEEATLRAPTGSRGALQYMLLTVLQNVFSPPNLPESPQLPTSPNKRNNHFS